MKKRRRCLRGLQASCHICISREKMICRTLLLIVLTSSVCGTFEYDSTPLYYQAEENTDVTAEWRFSSETNISIPSLKIHCVFLQPELRVFYHLDERFKEPQHQQFAGRVQCDKDALTTGRVRLHLSRVRTEDSGQYLCRMATKSGKKVKQFSLNITEARVWSEPETPHMEKPVTLEPEREGGIDVYAGLSLALGLIAVVVAFYLSAKTDQIRSSKTAD